MASSGNSSSSSFADGVGAVLRQLVPPRSSLVVGLSGGVDSVTLLAVLSELRGPLGCSVSALHVNHGISENAPRWARFCRELCARLNIALRVEEVSIGPYRAQGLEGAARRARYEAYVRAEGDFIVLAHHRDDQAETLMLQLLRGAGPLGLAGMPLLRPLEGSRAMILRPLLAYPRADIEAWALDRGLDWIDDESNDDTARQRNFVRHRVMPVIEEQFPSARVTMARAAGHLAEAGALLGELGRLDVAALSRDGEMEVDGLRPLGSVRARNALRTFIRSRGIPIPTAARLDELHRQLVGAAEDRSVLFHIGGWELRRYRGRVFLERLRASVSSSFREAWNGESVLPLLELGGVLKFKPEEGRGLSVQRLLAAPVTVRLRTGGERIRPDARRPRRALKKLLQERGMPPWRRERWPLLYCGEEFVCAPGLGEDCEWQAAPGSPGMIVSWEPMD